MGDRGRSGVGNGGGLHAMEENEEVKTNWI